MAFDLLHLIAAVVALVAHIAVEALGVGDLGGADALVVAALALAAAVLGRADVDVAGGIDEVVAASHHSAAEDVDVAAVGLQGGLAAHRQQGAGGFVQCAFALVFVVVHAGGAEVVAVVDGKAAAAAIRGLAVAVGGKAEVDVVFSVQKGVAFGAKLGALAVDVALGGDDVKVAPGLRCIHATVKLHTIWVTPVLNLRSCSSAIKYLQRLL